MKLVVFGTGKYWDNRKSTINQYDDVIAFLDNDANKHHLTMDGKVIYQPDEVATLDYDFILIMSLQVGSMMAQLFELGVPQEKILTYQLYSSKKNAGNMLFYKGQVENAGMKVLVITGDIIISGGLLSAIYLTDALMLNHADVTIATPYAEEEAISKLNSKGVSVCVMKTLPYLFDGETDFVKQYSFCFVNTLQMVVSASIISKYIPTLWWIHEPSDRYCQFYSNVIKEYGYLLESDVIRSIPVYAVSELAKRVFETNTNIKPAGVLPFGIPDTGICENSTNEKIVFSLIGNICDLKGQKVLAKALKILDDKKEDYNAWFIGKIQDKDYMEDTLAITRWSSCRFLGKLNREEMEEVLPQIDVVICASMEETMSMTIVEGMMYGKVCITTDNTGIADYIVNGENGFVFPAGDEVRLSEIMQWIIEHDCAEIRMNARKTYEKYFSMNCFSLQLNNVMSLTESVFLDRQ